MTDTTDRTAGIGEAWERRVAGPLAEFLTTFARGIAARPDVYSDDLVNSARAVLDNVEAPPLTLAEELRAWAEDASYDEDRDNLLHAADRADQMENDIAEARAEVEQVTRERERSLAQVQGLARRESDLTSEVRMLTEERDEARAEVERLNREQGRLHAQVQGLARRDGCHNSEVRMLTEERDEALAEAERLTADLAEAYKTRDARDDEVYRLRAEVERLTAERDRLEAAQHLSDGSAWGGPVREPTAQKGAESNAETPDPADVPLPMPPGDIPGTALPINVMTVAPDQRANMQGTLAGSLPDTADVKPGEAWIVECRGERRAAVKDNDYSVPWCTVNADGWFNAEKNEDVTLITRLVPAPRVITNPDELDRAKRLTVIRDGMGVVCERAALGDGWFTTGHGTDQTPYIKLPATVLWEPEVKK